MNASFLNSTTGGQEPVVSEPFEPAASTQIESADYERDGIDLFEPPLA
jgi:hypothetical protein